MVEQALTELFFLQGPDKDGALGEKQVAKLNRTLARLYDSGPEEFAADAAAPPPEPLPRGTMRYPAFRSHVHRAVTRFTDNALAKEQVMARLILEAKKKEDLADLEIAWSGGIIPNERPMVDEHVIELEELTAEESNKNVACWGPQTVLSDEKVQQLRGYLEVLKEAGKGEKTQQTIEAAKNLGQRALESSKQVLEIARESFQKQSEFVSQKSFHKQAFCDEPGPDGLCENTGRPQAASRLMAAARLAACARQPVAEAELPAHEVCEEQCSETIKLDGDARLLFDDTILSGIDDQLDETIRSDVSATLQDLAPGIGAGGSGRATLARSTPASPSGVRLPPPPPAVAMPVPPARQQAARASSASAKAAERPVWCYDAGDGLHVDIRAQPDFGAARTGHVLLPGEEFRVEREHRGEDGVLFLKLVDRRGWVFESKPGVGTMCQRIR
mmetsp:Transcript_124651/g.399337  ORF Transcript_124651/g.399337 Transcript_124651/m.399337 type:complete len:444 (-) Transcript_124651:335-1666(-)